MPEKYQIILLGFGVVFALHFVLKYFLSFILKQVLRSKTKLDDYLVVAIIKPLKISIWLIFLYISLSVFKDDYLAIKDSLIYLDAGFILIFLWLLLSIITQGEKFILSEKPKFDADIVRLFSKLIKSVIFFLVILSFLQFIGVEISSILTFGGVGGMVIGFAAKDMLANIFGGLMISLDKPFSVGDWIRVGDIEGTVEEIGWRMTKVRTFSKNPIYVPNNNFSTKAIETPSRMTNRRIREVIGISYNAIAVMPVLITQIENYLKNNVNIDKKALTMVYFNHFNDSSLDMVIYTFTQTTNWVEFQKIKGEVLLDIAKIIADNNAEIAYPTQTLNIVK